MFVCFVVVGLVKICLQWDWNSKWKLKVISDNPKPSWRALASPESPLCCSVRVCRQVSSPVSLWSSGRGSVTWWSCWRRRSMSPRSCRCSSECADICHTLYAPGGVRWRVTYRHAKHSWKHTWRRKNSTFNVHIFFLTRDASKETKWKGSTWNTVPVYFFHSNSLCKH